MKQKAAANGRKKSAKAKLIGRYIVADPKICHGKPTFRGTRIMVWQVLEMLTRGLAWETKSLTLVGVSLSINKTPAILP